MLEKGRVLGQRVPWAIRHIVCVLIISQLLFLLLYAIACLFSNDVQLRQVFAYYLLDASYISISLIWVKAIHKASIERLGIGRGKWSSSHVILCGIVAGIGCYLVTAMILGHQSRIDLYFQESIQSIIISKMTLSGLHHFGLVPIGEEIISRGYVYGYLRDKLGVLPGLLVQSAIYALFHFDEVLSGAVLLISQKVFMGMVFAALYEKSGSLYPSMISHGTLNLLAFFPSK